MLELLLGWELFFAVMCLFIAAIALLGLRVVYRREIERREETKETFRRLVEDSPVAIIIGKGSRCVFCNDAGVKLIGASGKEEVVGRNMLEFIHPDDQHRITSRFERLRRGEPAELDEVQVLRLDGEVIDVELKAIPTLYQGEQADYLMVRDITELKKSKEYLLHSEKLNVVGELAAGIAHEIRNPLTSLRGFVQLLQGSPRPDQVGQYGAIMLGEIDRINLIVSELLLLARPKQMNIVRKDLRELLEQTATLMNTQAILHNIRIDINFGAPGCDDSLSVDCEENKLKQVFINLLKNAIEAMPAGGVITIRVKRSGPHVLIRFEDQGCGIPPEHLPKLGQAFFSSKEKGTGLGLMISFSIIENHKGFMRITSTQGNGTQVELRLPIAP